MILKQLSLLCYCRHGVCGLPLLRKLPPFHSGTLAGLIVRVRNFSATLPPYSGRAVEEEEEDIDTREELQEALGEVKETYVHHWEMNLKVSADNLANANNSSIAKEITAMHGNKMVAQRQSVQAVRMDGFVRQIVDKLKKKGYSNEYMKKLDGHVTGDFLMESIMDEIKQEMKRSLRKSSDMIAYRLMLVKLARKEMDKAIAKRREGNATETDVVETILDYNICVDAAIQARQNFIIQRQACGMTAGSYAIVEKCFPIPHKLDPASFV